MIRLPRSVIMRNARERTITQEANAEYARPQPGITPGGAAFVGSWGMSQRITAQGHIGLENGQIVIRVNE